MLAGLAAPRARRHEAGPPARTPRTVATSTPSSPYLPNSPSFAKTTPAGAWRCPCASGTLKTTDRRNGGRHARAIGVHGTRKVLCGRRRAPQGKAIEDGEGGGVLLLAAKVGRAVLAYGLRRPPDVAMVQAADFVHRQQARRIRGFHVTFGCGTQADSVCSMDFPSVSVTQYKSPPRPTKPGTCIGAAPPRPCKQ